MLGAEVSVGEGNGALSVVVASGQAVQNELLTKGKIVDSQFSWRINKKFDRSLPIHSATICLRFSSGVSV